MSFLKHHVRNVIVAGAVAMTATPALAQEPNAYPITNVNLRAGPGTEYPVILTVPAEAPIAILGCLPDYTWCDSVFEDYRGWMRSIYLSGYYEGEYYLLRDWAPDLGYQTVTFNVGAYWDSYYRDQPFYGERARWVAPREEGYVDDAVFYNRLSPYGSWTWVQGQYVWVPGGVGRGWRPYTRGRWVYTDRGWTWASNEPFGWATYHYGRWGYSDRMGWFWVPGNRWAPAWVSWRQDEDYLAWAPLPPSYDRGYDRGGININISFGDMPDYYWSVVPSRDFLSDDLPRYYVQDRDRRRPFLERSRPIGNTTIINNKTIVNNVVNVNYVEQKTKKKVIKKTIRKTNNQQLAGKTEGEAFEVYEPPIEEEPETLAPPDPKTVEEVAETSETKGQAEGAAGTEVMLAPPEVEKAVKARKGKKGRGKKPGETGPGDEAGGPDQLDPSLPKGDEADTPPPPRSADKPKGEPVPAEDLGPPNGDKGGKKPGKDRGPKDGPNGEGPEDEPREAGPKGQDTAPGSSDEGPEGEPSPQGEPPAVAPAETVPSEDGPQTRPAPSAGEDAGPGEKPAGAEDKKGPGGNKKGGPGDKGGPKAGSARDESGPAPIGGKDGLPPGKPADGPPPPRSGDGPKDKPGGDGPKGPGGGAPKGSGGDGPNGSGGKAKKEPKPGQPNAPKGAPEATLTAPSDEKPVGGLEPKSNGGPKAKGPEDGKPKDPPGAKSDGPSGPNSGGPSGPKPKGLGDSNPKGPDKAKSKGPGEPKGKGPVDVKPKGPPEAKQQNGQGPKAKPNGKKDGKGKADPKEREGAG